MRQKKKNFRISVTNPEDQVIEASIIQLAKTNPEFRRELLKLLLCDRREGLVRSWSGWTRVFPPRPPEISDNALMRAIRLARIANMKSADKLVELSADELGRPIYRPRNWQLVRDTLVCWLEEGKPTWSVPANRLLRDLGRACGIKEGTLAQDLANVKEMLAQHTPSHRGRPTGLRKSDQLKIAAYQLAVDCGETRPDRTIAGTLANKNTKHNVEDAADAIRKLWSRYRAYGPRLLPFYVRENLDIIPDVLKRLGLFNSNPPVQSSSTKSGRNSSTRSSTISSRSR